MHQFRQLLIVLLLLLLAACGRSAGPQGPGGASGGQRGPGPTEATPTGVPAPSTQLDGTSWTLVALRGQPLLEGSTITLEFSADTAGGSAGCNEYGGRYHATAAGELALRDVAMTLMACQSQAVMDQEAAYTGALEQVAAYRLQGDQLELSSGGGEVLLVFSPARGR